MLFIITLLICGSYILTMLMLTIKLCYLFHHRHKELIMIRELPISTVLFVDLGKVKSNLKIELIVYNFLIVLCVLELLALVLFAIGEVGLGLCDLGDSLANRQFQSALRNENRTGNGSNICLREIFVAGRGLFILFKVFTCMADFAISADLAIVSLFLIVLRRST